MSAAVRIEAILRRDRRRWDILGMVAGLGLPDCWIAAGFVRNAVWDDMHGRPAAPPKGDIDVIWFDRERCDPATDRALELALRSIDGAIDWSVKNQARMHRRNGDAPYRSATDAMRYWPETATAVAARRIGGDRCEIASPLGLDDLLAGIVRPGPAFETAKRPVFEERLRKKNWLAEWPKLRRA